MEVPVLDLRCLLKDREIERQQDAEPEQLDDNLDQKIAAKRQFAEQAELGEGEPEFDVTQKHMHNSVRA